MRKPVEKYSSSNTITTEMSESEGAKFDEHYVEQVEIYTATIMPGEPTGYNDAVNGPDAEKWKEAMDDEIDSLSKLKTWITVLLPPGHKTVSCKWVYRIKCDGDGVITCYKARLVARGFSQVYGLNYDEKYAPVTCLETIRLLFALAVVKDWEIHQIDVKNAYLYGKLNKEIYMDPPLGYHWGQNPVFRPGTL